MAATEGTTGILLIRGENVVAMGEIVSQTTFPLYHYENHLLFMEARFKEAMVSKVVSLFRPGQGKIYVDCGMVGPDSGGHAAPTAGFIG